jgi:NAD(P)-dependent dehydrogenase (short-subunit alcohol dehydrogenase family)
VTTTVSSTSSSSSSVTVLGGTSTLGKSIISLFCDKNYKVYASYRSKHKAQSLLQALSEAKIKNKPSLFEYHFNEMNYNYNDSNITTIHDYDNIHNGDDDSLSNDLIPRGFGSCSPY